jgi:hypothetical protein
MKFRNAAAAVLVLVLATGLAVAASFAFGSDDANSSKDAATSCRTSGWPATAVGAPNSVASGRATAFYVWQDARAWHLRARKISGSSPLEAKVQANARLRVVAATPGARAGLKARERSLILRVSANGLSGIDFKDSCANRVGFKLGFVQPAPAGSRGPIPGGQGSPPQVFLGRSGRAPAATFRVNRPATTGAAGRILLGGTCKGPASCQPPKPVAGTVRIETAPGKEDGTGQLVTRVRSDEHGNCSAELSPGRYRLLVEKQGGYPVAKPTIAQVEAGVVTLVDLYLDSGIR